MLICGYHLAIIRPDKQRVLGRFLRKLLLVPDVHYQFVKADQMESLGMN